MTYIREFTELVSKASTITPLHKSKTGGRGSAVIVYGTDGEISEINVSSSLITRFYNKGDRLENICLLQNYVYFIERKYEYKVSEPMLAGQYLESQLIGETADGTTVTDMPRDKRTGKKRELQKRIDQHVAYWPMLKDLHGLIVNESGEYKNVQVRHKQKWAYRDNPDINVWVWVTMDLVSPFKDTGIDYEMAVCDIKYTGDLTSTYGKYPWGDIARMDLFQAILYSRVMNLPFVYLVFDGTKELRFRAIPINVNPNHEDPIKANEAKYRILQTEQTIDRFVNDIILYEKSGWTMNPSNENCEECQHIYCKFYGKKFEQ